MGHVRTTYKLIIEINGQKTKGGQIPVLNTCQLQCEDPTRKGNPNQFEQFNNIGKTVTKNLPAMNPVLLESAVHHMLPYETSCAEVTSIFASLDEKFFSGDDEIHNVLVKLTSSVTVPYLTTLCNRSLNECVFPNSLKKAKVIPIHEEGSKLNEDNHARYHYSLYGAKFSKKSCTPEFTGTSKNLNFSVASSTVSGRNFALSTQFLNWLNECEKKIGKCNQLFSRFKKTFWYHRPWSTPEKSRIIRTAK